MTESPEKEPTAPEPDDDVPADPYGVDEPEVHGTEISIPIR